jgi:hypothetical protein
MDAVVIPAFPDDPGSRIEVLLGDESTHNALFQRNSIHLGLIPVLCCIDHMSEVSDMQEGPYELYLADRLREPSIEQEYLLVDGRSARSGSRRSKRTTKRGLGCLVAG